MSTIETIRKALGLTQAEFGAALGVSQGSVSFYENGKTVPPDVARKVIEVAGEKGHPVTFDDIYGAPAATGASA